MGFSLLNIPSIKKLENTIFLAVILLVFKILFPESELFIVSFVTDLLVIAILYFGSLYAKELFPIKMTGIISVILNNGILNALLFFILAISSVVMPSKPSFSQTNLIYIFITTILNLAFAVAVLFIFNTKRELFFLKQKKDPKFFFNTMLVFALLTALSTNLHHNFESLEFMSNAFSVVTIILIIINSLKVSWIAFLLKRQKISLLIISIVLSAIFITNASFLMMESEFVSHMIINFSPALHTFSWLLMVYGAIYYAVIFFTTLFHLPTAEAFDRKAEEVSSLMDLSKLITQVFDFKELADTVTDLTIKVSNSDAAWLITEKDGSYELSSVKNIGYVEAEKISEDFRTNNPNELLDISTVNLNSLKFSLKNDVVTSSYKILAVAPLKVHKNTNGFLYVVRTSNLRFDEDDKKAITAFADYAAVALENALLLERSIEKERLEKELDVAREIQNKILPRTTPEVNNLEISSLFVPAFEVGGDYYDFFKLKNNKMGFVIADVSGKGIQAAFIMAEVKGIFGSLARIIESPKELLIKANEILIESLAKNSFVTAIYGIIDFNTNKMKFARAGHMPLLFCREETIKQYIPQGLGLGLNNGSTFINTLEENEIDLEDEDVIVLYTDGITEAKNASNRDFGDSRFEKLICENRQNSVDKITSEIMKAVSLFSKNNNQHDDITLVVFKLKNNHNNKFGVN
ncbi:MAG: SpoIIE family protein phosphatase [Melioribacteraceae bacterium]|nr:SpoIIE family protein phosphatase [Melioribacteraceae bacterium]